MNQASSVLNNDCSLDGPQRYGLALASEFNPYSTVISDAEGQHPWGWSCYLTERDYLDLLQQLQVFFGQRAQQLDEPFSALDLSFHHQQGLLDVSGSHRMVISLFYLARLYQRAQGDQSAFFGRLDHDCHHESSYVLHTAPRQINSHPAYQPQLMMDAYLQLADGLNTALKRKYGTGFSSNDDLCDHKFWLSISSLRDRSSEHSLSSRVAQSHYQYTAVFDIPRVIDTALHLQGHDGLPDCAAMRQACLELLQKRIPGGVCWNRPVPAALRRALLHCLQG